MIQNLDSRLQSFLTEKKFTQLTQIQQETLPYALKGRDVIAISKTGTGKTYAYLFPLFLSLDTELNQTQAVIVCPTQELTQQIHQFALELAKHFEAIRIQKATRGIERTRLKKAEQPHVLIGTLGKLKSAFFEDNLFRIDHVKTLVIDEADMMLDADNLRELDELAGKMPKRLQTMVFSATIPDTLNAFMRSYMHQPQVIKIQQDLAFDPRIEHILIPIKEDVNKKLLQLMNLINPSLCLIFAKDGKQLESITTLLREKGIRFASMHGKLAARERMQIFKQIQDGQIVYVVSTDVAARGLDLEAVSDVISLGFPKDLSFYTHRAGRTGRAGKTGRVFALYEEADDVAIRKLIDGGLVFKHQTISSEGFRTLKSYNYVHGHKKTKLDKEISQIVLGRSKVVKPGYKKKLTAQIELLKRKRRRKMIQDSIKAQHKHKSKMNQIEKKKD